MKRSGKRQTEKLVAARSRFTAAVSFAIRRRQLVLRQFQM
jgi:hypothetical protein